VTIFFNDFETKSRSDIKKVGARRYARDPSTKVLMLAYAFDNGPIEQWVPAEGEKMPGDLRDAIRDPEVQKRSWNASMEMSVWREVCGVEIFPDEWRCTQTQAMCLSAPTGLGMAGPIFDLPLDLQKEQRGKALINRFCKPRKPTKHKPWVWSDYLTDPEEWDEFKGYNRADIAAERGIYNRIRKWDLPQHEWDLWCLDYEINNDGIPINMNVVTNAIKFVEHIRAKRYARIKQLTGVDNPRSNPQLLEWLNDNGYRFSDMQAAHVKKAAEDTRLSDTVREVLAMRAEIAKTSTDKYYAMERAVDLDHDIIQGCLQFAGAQRTWRWSGRLIQPQNLARPHPALEKLQEVCVEHLEHLTPEALELVYDKSWKDVQKPGPIDMLSTCIRPTVQAPKGMVMVSADLNAIENRVLGYLSGDQKILNVFRNNLDPYIDFATKMYGDTYEAIAAEVAAGNKKKRTVAKPGVLGCGYMLSAGEEKENHKTGEMEATGLLGYAWNMGVKLTAQEAIDSVRVWRDTYEDAVAYWWEIEKAAKLTMKTDKEAWAGPVRFARSGPFLQMWLPSGRCLSYMRPRLEDVELIWCEKQKKYLPEFLCKEPNKKKTKEKVSLTYEGLNDKNKWVRIQTHPGKLTENADQAISRDILATSMMRFRKRVPRNVGRLVLHVHDEPVAIAQESKAEWVLKTMEECLREPMPWATEKELPLYAKGSIGKVWIKD